MAWWNWSLTAGNNASADATINWAEGMSPSAVNDSARTMMARSAEYRDLISGKILTTGTSTALVLATGQTPVFDTLAHLDGAMIGFTAHVTNTGAVTIAIDGLTAVPIRSQTGTAGNLGAGVIVAGTPYIGTYYNATTEIILQGFVGNPYAVPLGSFLFHSVNTAPNSNFVLPIGQAISRTTYAAYFAMVGTTFGVGDGVTTFNVPDLRSYLLATSILGGGDPGRITTAGSGIDGATIGAHGGAETVTVAQANLPNVALNPTTPNQTLGHTSGGGTARSTNSGSVSGSFASPGGAAGFTADKFVAIDDHTVTFPTVSLGGSGTALNKMPPTFILPVVLRVL